MTNEKSIIGVLDNVKELLAKYGNEHSPIKVLQMLESFDYNQLVEQGALYYYEQGEELTEKFDSLLEMIAEIKNYNNENDNDGLMMASNLQRGKGQSPGEEESKSAAAS